MKDLLSPKHLVPFVLTASLAFPQGRPVDWPSIGGDARRTGWERSDTRITKDNVKDFQFLYKRKLEGTEAGPRTSTPPVIIGLLISYRGFKELGFVSNSSGDLWSIDVDLNRVFWKKRIDLGKASGACGSIATVPTLTPPMVFGRRRPGAAGGGGTNTPSPGQPPTPAGQNTARKPHERVGGTGFGAPRPVYMVAGDGKLRQLNTSDGSDQFPALDFLPPNARTSSLTLTDNFMYAVTAGNCGGSQDGVYALDLAEDEPKPVSFPLNGGDATGLGALAVGNDGTVYVQTGPGASDPSSNKWSNTLLALAPRTLKLTGHFSTGASAAAKGWAEMATTAPVVFDFAGTEMVATATADGRLVLLNASSFSGDHKTPVAQSAPITSQGGGIWGALATWEDANGERWLAAPVWGAVNSATNFPANNGAVQNGAIVAFKIQDNAGRPTLQPAWISPDISSPVPPVVTSGVVFALSTGGYNEQGTDWKPKNGARATLYALDAATGKQLYSSGTQVTAPGSLTGLTVANGRVFFTTVDGTLWSFGIFMEI